MTNSINQDYVAPAPTYSTSQWAKYIATRLLVAPLIWDGVKYGCNALLGSTISNLVLPAQEFSPEEYHIESFHDEFIAGENGKEYGYKDNKYGCYEYSYNDFSINYPNIRTNDGAKLDTVEFIHESQNSKNISEQKYIINYVGNGMCYEHAKEDMLNDVNKLNCNVIGFNFRGVASSTGKATSKDDLLTDSIAQVQRLLDKGVTPNNIVLQGHSLGASIATLTAAHFHQQGVDINVFNGRSFSTLTNVVIGQVRKNIGAVFSFILMPFIKLALLITNWEIDAASAYKSIPDNNREYMVVLGDNNYDPVITTYGGLHSALNNSEQHEYSKVVDHGKFIGNLHNVEASLLSNQEVEPKNGFDLFSAFFNRATNNEGVDTIQSPEPEKTPCM